MAKEGIVHIKNMQSIFMNIVELVAFYIEKIWR